MTKWLDEASFYEIYPQTFKDSNGDGIGDFAGIATKLDYVQSLGCNAIWLNPCYDSPFMDAGYDVRNYYLAAPRYGTNEDLKALFDEVHRRGMHIILDLVPGHTSDECAWFKESCKAARNEYTDRYVWTDSVWTRFDGVDQIAGAIRGGTERDGACAANFFNCQPALNYGFAEPDPEKPWQMPMSAPGPQATVEEIKNVMRFWLGLGCDGFRVDMAGSLVKKDPGQRGTIRLWQQFRKFLDEEFPDAVLVSEWGQADRSLAAGFHMDFLLHFGPSHYPELFRTDAPYFARKGGGDCKAFFDLYTANLAKTKEGRGLICFTSGNHDMIRMAKTLDPEEMKIAFAFIYAMPGVPFLYYGDEIGTRYEEGLASVEGGYERTGSRTPMAWDNSTNYGFSAAPADRLYIRQDESCKEINVAAEEQDPASLLHFVRKVQALRKAHPALGNRGVFDLVELKDHSMPLVFLRKEADPETLDAKEGGEQILVVFNPGAESAVLESALPASYETLFAYQGHEEKSDAVFGRDASGNVTVPGESAVVLKIS